MSIVVEAKPDRDGRHTAHEQEVCGEAVDDLKVTLKTAVGMVNVDPCPLCFPWGWPDV